MSDLGTTNEQLITESIPDLSFLLDLQSCYITDVGYITYHTWLTYHIETYHHHQLRKSQRPHLHFHYCRDCSLRHVEKRKPSGLPPDSREDFLLILLLNIKEMWSICQGRVEEFMLMSCLIIVGLSHILAPVLFSYCKLATAAMIRSEAKKLDQILLLIYF